MQGHDVEDKFLLKPESQLKQLLFADPLHDLQEKWHAEHIATLF
jgi:hypothetical protein